MSYQTNLKQIILLDMNLALIEAHTLTAALIKVEKVRLYSSFHHSSDITPLQAQSLFTAISRGVNLKKMFLLSKSLIYIDQRILAQALNNLEEFSLCQDMISDVQTTSLFSKMSEKTSRKKFKVYGINLFCVQPIILASGVSQITELSLVDCWSERRCADGV